MLAFASVDSTGVREALSEGEVRKQGKQCAGEQKAFSEMQPETHKPCYRKGTVIVKYFL
jgi:hypothetical protein